VECIGLGGLSRRQAARELAIGYATLKRLLDAHLQPAEQQNAGVSSPPAAADYSLTPRCSTDKIAEQLTLTFSLDNDSLVECRWLVASRSGALR